MIREILNGSWVPVYQHLPLEIFFIYVVFTLVIESFFLFFLIDKPIKEVIVISLCLNLISAFFGLIFLIIPSMLW